MFGDGGLKRPRSRLGCSAIDEITAMLLVFNLLPTKCDLLSFYPRRVTFRVFVYSLILVRTFSLINYVINRLVSFPKSTQ